jgi:GT2 family glycosyltransferase
MNVSPRLSLALIRELPASDHLPSAECAELERVVIASGGTVHDTRTSLEELQDDIRERAMGSHILILGAHEVPSENLLEHVSGMVEAHPLADVFYGDISVNGSRTSPVLRPDWSPTRLQHENYVGESVLVRTSFFLSMTEEVLHTASWDAWSFLLGCVRVGAIVEHDRWAWTSAPVAEVARRQRLADDDHGRVARVHEHLSRLGSRRTVRIREATKRLEIIPDVTSVLPSHAFITLTAGSSDPAQQSSKSFVSQHLEAIRRLDPTATAQQIVVVGSECTAVAREELESASHPELTLLDVTEVFNFAHRSNAGRNLTDADVLIFVNDDFVPFQEKWVHHLLAPFEDEKVAITGATLLYHDGSIQHAGVGVTHSNYFHAHLGVGPGDEEWEDVIVTNREVDAVTGACFAIRSAVFDEVGGFFEGFPFNFNDVDLCLKARSQGYSVVHVGTPLGFHFESKTREAVVLPAEAELFSRRWPERPQFSEFPFELPRWGETTGPSPQ